MALGGTTGGVAPGFVSGGGRQGSPRSAGSTGSVSQRRSSPPAREPEGSKPNSLKLGEVFKNRDVLLQILSHTKVDQINMLEKVNKAIKDNVFEYCKTKNVYRLDLSNVESAEKIHQLLMKIKDVDKIKITGLNKKDKYKKAKFNLFNQALNTLKDVTFNTIQCDLSRNQLTKNQFKQINTRLLSKMSRLTSLNLYNNNIEAAGATAIANSQYMSNLTSLDLFNNKIGAEGDMALRTRFPFVRAQIP